MAKPSQTKKYAAPSTASPKRAARICGSHSIVTPSGKRAARPSIASTMPWSDSTAGWMPGGELAQVLQRLARLDLQVAERLAQPARSARQLAARQADPRDERDELLLGAVVDVALDLAPRRLLRGDDP